MEKPRYVRRKGDARLTETISVKLAPDLVDALSVHAIRRGEFNSDIIRRGIEMVLAAETETQ